MEVAGLKILSIVCVSQAPHLQDTGLPPSEYDEHLRVLNVCKWLIVGEG